MQALGNDVVDLRHPACRGKTTDLRFLRRIFAQEEIEAIEGASRPAGALWVRWAAKEAAFKVVTKLLGDPPPFEHSAFRVRMADDDPQDPVGAVTYGRWEIPVRGEVDHERVHVLAFAPDAEAYEDALRTGIRRIEAPAATPDADWKERFRDRFTEREWRSVYQPASALVRVAAREDLARALGRREREVEIVCDPGPPGRMPPRILIEGRECPGDVSLSHHGRFLAWVFTLPAESDPAGNAGST